MQSQQISDTASTIPNILKPLSIVTHNIQGYNEITKRQNWLDSITTLSDDHLNQVLPKAD
jgi:hypothetical protein